MENNKFEFELASGTKVVVKIDDSPSIDELELPELESYLAELEDQLEVLESEEPDECECDEYDEWEERRDELEALINEVEDRIDELRE